MSPIFAGSRREETPRCPVAGGSSSTPAAKPAAGLSAPASPVPASPAIEGVASPKPIQAQAPTAPSRAPVLTISPEAATITADDPGVQLLLRWQSADGTVKDLTGLAAWRVDPPGFGVIEAGGYLRPLADGTVSVKAVFEGQEVAALINVEPRGIVRGTLPATSFPS